ncbi:hypothetical protein O181_125625 [Austropuccinia psidii MF-1]|uniref:Uncharacterized protein n=1 Tax=Austropuccinia psidii MF-1 TaxID=1389203 RepID=A0A9Q3KV81_9BASI|nr:hypothetical protein [Austropuccinia psidii MF-1]
MPSTRSGGSYNHSRSAQKVHRRDYGKGQSVTERQGSVDHFQIHKLCHYEADDTVLPSHRAYTTTRILIVHIQSQPEGLQQSIAAQRVPDPFRSVEKLQEFLPDCEKIPWSSQHFQVAQWKTQASAKDSPSGQQKKFQCEKAATSSEQGQRKGTSHKALQPGLQHPKYSEGFHGKCIPDGQNNDVITEEGGSQTKISEMLSDFLILSQGCVKLSMT